MELGWLPLPPVHWLWACGISHEPWLWIQVTQFGPGRGWYLYRNDCAKKLGTERPLGIHAEVNLTCPKRRLTEDALQKPSVWTGAVCIISPLLCA